MKTAIILGSVRQGRQSHKAGYYLKEKLEERFVETTIIDLAATPLPILETQSAYPAPIAETVEAISKTLEEADALLFVTPEYHGSFSGAIKNAIDYFWSEFQKKPIGVVAASSGRMGGINASTQLQHVILSLGAYPLPVKFLIPEIHQAFDDSFRPARESVSKAGERFLREFLWFAEAIAAKKEQEANVQI